MLQLTTNQYNAINSNNHAVVWLFDVIDNSGATHRYASIDYSFNGYFYSGRVIKNSFRGITERRRCHEDGRWTATECVFSIEAVSTDINTSNFDNGRVIVRLVINNEQIRDWHFKITSVGKAYKRVTFSCTDLLTSYLTLNDYPTTRLIKDIFLDRNAVNDTMCVPVMFGTVFAPLRPVWCTPAGKSEGRYYLLGPASADYTVYAIRTPREHPNTTTWTTGLNICTAGNYKVLEAIIADSDDDGTNDTQGLWWASRLLDAPVRFSRSDTASVTNPGDILAWILSDFGIPSGYIDVSAKSTFDTWNLSWNGILAFKQDRSSLIARLLVQCGSVLDPREKITLRILRKTSVSTLTRNSIVAKTFTYNPSGIRDLADSGYIAWQADSEPWDQYQQLAIPITESIAEPSSISYLMDFVHDQQKALALGQIALQRTLGVIGYARCTVTPSNLMLQPYDVITIADDIYWPGTYEIDEVNVLPSGYVELTLRRYNHSINDLEDLAPVERDVPDAPIEVIWSIITPGPDNDSGHLQNGITGRVTIGSDRDTRIVLDPLHPNVTGPVIELIENDKTRFRLGKLGGDNYGLVTYSNTNHELIRIDSNIAKLCGWTMTETKLSAAGIELDAENRQLRAYNSSNMVTLSPAGLTGYDSVLGYTIKIPTDGSAPMFSSGIIKECVYEIYTSGIIRTSDNPAADGGILINSTGIKGYNTSGALKFKLDAATGTIWAQDAQISGTVTVGAGSSVPWDYVTGSNRPEDNATNNSSWSHPSDTTSIDGGKVYVGSSLTIGSSTVGGRLIINSSKTGYADGVIGVFLGYSNGFKFELYGNSTNYIRWTGSSLAIAGSITVGSGSSIPWDAITGSNRPENNATNNSSWNYPGTTYIDGGDIYVGSRIKIGSSTVGGSLIINSSKTGYADGVVGVFLGYSNGFKFEIYGNSTNYIRWTGSSLVVAGSITVGSGSSIPWDAITGSNRPENNATNNSSWNYPGTTYIDGGKIYTGTITANEIAAGTITANEIAVRTINGINIADGTITGLNIANNTITGINIANSTITGSKIAGSTITGAHIVDSTITGSEIAANTITASKINGTNFGDLVISSGSVTINTQSGLTINAYNGIFLKSSGTIRFCDYSTGPQLYGIPSTLYVYGAQSLNLKAVETVVSGQNTAYRLWLFNDSSTYTTTSFLPVPGGAWSCGNSYNYWARLQAVDVYYKWAYTFDTEDDLALIESLPIIVDNNNEPVLNRDGLVQFDISAMDPRLTNMRTLAKELSVEASRKITLEDLISLRHGGVIDTRDGNLTWNDVKDRVFLNLPAMNALSIGAVRQLNRKVDEIRQRLDALENGGNK